MNIEINS